MKPELSELRKWLQTLLKKQNRARLALVLGCIAMALILLSELFPAKAPAAPQAVSPEEGTYKTQLEQQLTELEQTQLGQAEVLERVLTGTVDGNVFLLRGHYLVLEDAALERQFEVNQ